MKAFVTAFLGQVGETFDWRLSIPNVEKRDAYFTRLKVRIELITEIAKEKVWDPCYRLSRLARDRCHVGLPPL